MKLTRFIKHHSNPIIQEDLMITSRRYRLLADFEPVSQFLIRHTNFTDFNGYLLQPFFEYAHTHPYFNAKLTHRFGVWEDDGTIVGVTCYEMDLGECLLVSAPGYEHLRPQMLDHAERDLSTLKDGQRFLNVMTTDKQGLDALLSERGYERHYHEAITTFDYAKGFKQRPLPKGFRLISLDEENDVRKIHACLHQGFNHGPTPDEDVDSRWLMQSAPRFRKDLTTVVVAPDGTYACFAGMWVDHVNHYAYLEPLATVPQYRRLGLAHIALTEAMQKTVAEGATFCFGGSREFYTAMGFETVGIRQFWKKTWREQG
jgi:GNAT superfamily N-acetyltransferase